MKYEQKGTEIGRIVSDKQKAYGKSVEQTTDLVKIFLRNYKNDDGTYTIPESLIYHILLQVRIIDKQNRIFNNPDEDMMSESPYLDISGYGILGEISSSERKNTDGNGDQQEPSIPDRIKHFTDPGYEDSYEEL